MHNDPSQPCLSPPGEHVIRRRSGDPWADNGQKRTTCEHGEQDERPASQPHPSSPPSALTKRLGSEWWRGRWCSWLTHAHTHTLGWRAAAVIQWRWQLCCVEAFQQNTLTCIRVHSERGTKTFVLMHVLLQERILFIFGNHLHHSNHFTPSLCY